MGAKGWQRLHNAVYVFAALALIHYLLSPDIYPEQYLLSGMFFWLVVWRVLNHRGHGTDVRALAMLAVASGLFTALLEGGWIWAYHGYAASGTLGHNFTLDLGISPAWQILALGVDRPCSFYPASFPPQGDRLSGASARSRDGRR
jgi:methionine sulfoxide reductase heme-binding subunit